LFLVNCDQDRNLTRVPRFHHFQFDYLPHLIVAVSIVYLVLFNTVFCIVFQDSHCIPGSLPDSLTKLYELYDDVETFVMFIGYPRSSHSLVGSILDAHHEIIIPKEYHIIQRWNIYAHFPRGKQPSGFELKNLLLLTIKSIRIMFPVRGKELQQQTQCNSDRLSCSSCSWMWLTFLRHATPAKFIQIFISRPCVHFDEETLRTIYTMRLWRMRSAYSGHTTWLGTIYTRTTIFSYKIKYANVCARIYGPKVLTNGRQIF